MNKRSLYSCSIKYEFQLKNCFKLTGQFCDIINQKWLLSVVFVNMHGHAQSLKSRSTSNQTTQHRVNVSSASEWYDWPGAVEFYISMSLDRPRVDVLRQHVLNSYVLILIIFILRSQTASFRSFSSNSPFHTVIPENCCKITGTTVLFTQATIFHLFTGKTPFTHPFRNTSEFCDIINSYALPCW